MTFSDIMESIGYGNAEADEQLTQMFIRTSDYERVDSNLRNLVLGGRGAGKSAICKMLESVKDHPDVSSQRRTQWVASLSPDVVSWRTLERAANSVNNDT